MILRVGRDVAHSDQRVILKAGDEVTLAVIINTRRNLSLPRRELTNLQASSSAPIRHLTTA